MTILSDRGGNTAAILDIFAVYCFHETQKRLLQRCICFDVSTIENEWQQSKEKEPQMS